MWGCSSCLIAGATMEIRRLGKGDEAAFEWCFD